MLHEDECKGRRPSVPAIDIDFGPRRHGYYRAERSLTFANPTLLFRVNIHPRWKLNAFAVLLCKALAISGRSHT